MPVEPLGRVSGSKPLDPLDAWLILPAVICSDKRLSHACLRICVQLNLRTAHYNSYNLFELCILNGYLR